MSFVAAAAVAIVIYSHYCIARFDLWLIFRVVVFFIADVLLDAFSTFCYYCWYLFLSALLVDL